MTAVERIRALTNSLPNSDIVLANTFIDTRDFESLQELVDSAIIGAKKSLRSDNPKEEYLCLDMDNLSVLKSEVDVYVEQLQIPTSEYQEEEFYNEEYYE